MWVEPTTRSVGFFVTASVWNTDIVANLKHIINSSGNLSVVSAGPHGIGAAGQPQAMLRLAGTFTPASSAVGFVAGSLVEPTINALTANDAHGVVIQPSLVEAGTSIHNYFTSVTIVRPSIVSGAASLNNAATLFLAGLPTGATNTYGLLLDAIGDDGHQIALSDSTDVAHGMTSVAATSVYGIFSKGVAATGGLGIRGLSEDVIGIAIRGNGTNEDTASTSAALGAVQVDASKRSGTALTQYGTTANIFVVRNEGGGARWIVKGNGDVYRDGTDNTYFAAPSGERYDDPMLALAWEHNQNPHPGLADLQRQHGRYTTQDLLDAGLLGELDPATGRHFYNESALVRLSAGALWTCALELRDLQQRVAALEGDHRA